MNFPRPAASYLTALETGGRQVTVAMLGSSYDKLGICLRIKITPGAVAAIGHGLGNIMMCFF